MVWQSLQQQDCNTQAIEKATLLLTTTCFCSSCLIFSAFSSWHLVSFSAFSSSTLFRSKLCSTACFWSCWRWPTRNNRIVTILTSSPAWNYLSPSSTARLACKVDSCRSTFIVLCIKRTHVGGAAKVQYPYRILLILCRQSITKSIIKFDCPFSFSCC